jgi:hypothetical protein
MLLDGKSGVVQEGEILDVGWIVEIDQDAEALARFWSEGRFKEALQAEGGEGSGSDLLGNR